MELAQTTDKNETIRKALLRRVHMLGKECGMSHEDLHNSFCEQYNVSSLSALKVGCLRQIRDSLSGQISKPRKYSGHGSRDGYKSTRITNGQARKIGALAVVLGWDEKRVNGFIYRQTKDKRAVEWLMKYQATRVIIGLQRVIAGKDQALYRFLNGLKASDMDEEQISIIKGLINAKSAD